MGFKTCLYTVVSEVTYNDVGRSLPEAGLDTGRESVQNVWNLEMWDLVERKSLEKQNLCDLPPAFSNENLTSRYCMVLPELPRENSQPAIFTRANCADAAKLAFHVMGDGNYVLAVEYLFFLGYHRCLKGTTSWDLCFWLDLDVKNSRNIRHSKLLRHVGAPIWRTQKPIGFAIVHDG